MKLLNKTIRDRLLSNGQLMMGLRSECREEPDLVPVVKLFTPDGPCTWLLTELDPGDEDVAFGLCDLGMGFPELGSVRISELERIKGPLGLSVERDRYFSASKTISAYADEARAAGQIRA